MRAFYETLGLLYLITIVTSQNGVESTSPCQPSHEWSRVCVDCVCELADFDRNENFDTLDACKLYAENNGYDIISYIEKHGNCRVGYEAWCSSTRSKDDSETHKLKVETCPAYGPILIAGAPANGNAEVVNPNPSQKLGEVQCCKNGSCTRKSSSNVCLSGSGDDGIKMTFREATNLCEGLGSGWSLCTRAEVNSNICNNKGCSHDRQLVWAIDHVDTVWSNMKGFDSILSNDEENSIEIRIDQGHDHYVHEDCKTLCKSVGSVCLNGWRDEEMTKQIGCSNNNKDTFVCSCAIIDDLDRKSKVINYDDCTSEYAVTGHGHGHHWPFVCPANTAVVSVETRAVESDEQKFTTLSMQCCGLVDKLTGPQNCDRIPEESHHKLLGGGSSSVEDQWLAQCGPNAIMVGMWDDDTKGDFDDIDAAKCCTLDTPFTSGKKIDNDDCVVVNLSPNSKSSCPLDYVLVGIYDHETTQFERLRKMKCCRVLESILPTVSPTQMPTTDMPSECPTVSPVTSIPSVSPTTNDPTLYPSQSPTTDQPTNAPSLSPSTSEPSISPSLSPSFSVPTSYPTMSPSKNPTTDEPTALPTISPSTDQPTKFPTTSPSTGEPSAFPTTEDPSSFPTMQPSTDSPTKFPSQNPTTDDPTAFPSTRPTNAPTMCEPTCRSHADQVVNILGRLLDFNSELLKIVRRRSEPHLTTVLNEMTSDLEQLKHQMNIVTMM